MVRSKNKLIVWGFVGFFVFLLASSMNMAQAASLGPEFVEDDRLHLLIKFDGISITEANETSPIDVNMDELMSLYMQVNVTNDVPLNITGTIWFYFHDNPIIPITIGNNQNGDAWIMLPHNVTIPPPTYYLNFSAILDFAGFPLMTGLFKASFDFTYQEMDPTNSTRSSIVHTLSQIFYINFPSEGISDNIDTVIVVIVVGGIVVVSVVVLNQYSKGSKPPQIVEYPEENR